MRCKPRPPPASKRFPGDALNVVALRAGAGGQAALAKLREIGADGRHFGAPDTVRLTLSNSTAEALGNATEKEKE